MKVGPFVSGQYSRVGITGFSETGSQAPLSFASQSGSNLTSDLGAQASRQWNWNGIALSPAISLAWEHVYEGSLDSLTSNFANGSNFTVDGPATGTDAAVIKAALEARFARGFSAYAGYEGQVGLTNFSQQNLSGGVNIGF
jgi:outer membrane autotransporter protein